MSVSISGGSPKTYASGGNSGNYGGIGGGANTGNGGSGGYNNDNVTAGGPGYAGGSGIVIVRLPIPTN
jgi:hypothetical protein